MKHVAATLIFSICLVLGASSAWAGDSVQVTITSAELNAGEIATLEREAAQLGTRAQSAKSAEERARLYQQAGERWSKASSLRKDGKPATRVHFSPGTERGGRAKAIAWLKANPKRQGSTLYVQKRDGRMGIGSRPPRARGAGLFNRDTGGGLPSADEGSRGAGADLARLAAASAGKARASADALASELRRDERRREEQSRQRESAPRRKNGTSWTQIAQELQRVSQRPEMQDRRRAAAQQRRDRERRAWRAGQAQRAQAARAWARQISQSMRGRQAPIRVGDTSAASRANGTLGR